MGKRQFSFFLFPSTQPPLFCRCGMWELTTLPNPKKLRLLSFYAENKGPLFFECGQRVPPFLRTKRHRHKTETQRVPFSLSTPTPSKNTPSLPSNFCRVVSCLSKKGGTRASPHFRICGSRTKKHALA